LSLVKTCRAWNELVTPLLYEHVSIVTDQQYRRARDIFIPQNGTRSINGLVSRVDIVRPNVQNACLQATVDLCDVPPNLKTLVASVAMTNDDEPPALLNSLPPSLEHLYWMQHKAGDYGEQLFLISTLIQFHHSHPNLAALSILFDFQPPTSQGAQSRKKLKWPSVQALVLQRVVQAKHMADHLPLGAFLNLRSINMSCCGPIKSNELQDFMSVHASQGIDSMRFDTILQQLTATISPTEVHICGKSINREQWLRKAAKLSHVTTLGLHWGTMPAQMPLCQEIATMHRIVSFPWTKVFPNLRTIRLMVEDVDIAFYKEHDHVTVQRLTSPGRYVRNPIRVEDIGGRMLGELSAGLSSLVGGPANLVPHCDVSPARRSGRPRR
ncbi:hypothetical protein FA13DRAFT_1736065, partial [Coprinellus micaceus]